MNIRERRELHDILYNAPTEHLRSEYVRALQKFEANIRREGLRWNPLSWPGMLFEWMRDCVKR